MENRFLVFIWADALQLGGWNDFHGYADTLDDAKAMGERGKVDHVQIIDMQTRKQIVGRRDKKKHGFVFAWHTV